MSALYENLLPQAEGSFYIGIFQDNIEKCTWHYHNTYEISFITEGAGKRIVGDSIMEFHPGDLVFIGKNLPHVWIPEKDQGIWLNRNLEMVFLQFTSDVLCQHILSLPEFVHVQKALTLSERGILITGQTLNEVSALMLQMPYLKDFERMIYFLKILDLIGRGDGLTPLASREYLKTRFSTANRRIEIIHEYMMNNYRNEIDLEHLSGLVNMAKGSVCRYFKQNTGITVFEYLNKIKAEFACKLLMNNDLSIMDVCLDSGYNSLSHFNKQFKKATGITPREYRKRFGELSPARIE